MVISSSSTKDTRFTGNITTTCNQDGNVTVTRNFQYILGTKNYKTIGKPETFPSNLLRLIKEQLSEIRVKAENEAKKPISILTESGKTDYARNLNSIEALVDAALAKAK